MSINAAGDNCRRPGIKKSDLRRLFVEWPKRGDSIRLRDGQVTAWYLTRDFCEHFGVSPGFMGIHAGKPSVLHVGMRLRKKSFYVISARRRGRPKKLTAWNGDDADNILSGKDLERPELSQGHFARRKRQNDQRQAEAFCRQIKRELPILASEAITRARNAGISSRRTYAAMKKAGIKSTPDAGRCVWWWHLPGQLLPSGPDAAGGTAAGISAEMLNKVDPARPAEPAASAATSRASGIDLGPVAGLPVYPRNTPDEPLHTELTDSAISRLAEAAWEAPSQDPIKEDGGGDALRFIPGAFIYRGHQEPLTGKPWEVLKALANAVKRTLTLNELQDMVWPQSAIGEETVRSAVSDARAALRKALEAVGVTKPASAKRDWPIIPVDRGQDRTAWRLDVP